MQRLLRGAGAGRLVNQAFRGFTPLRVAAEMGHLALVRWLVAEGGADVNLGDLEGITPLYRAAAEGHLAVVKYLVMEGNADVNKATDDDCTPLFIAAQRGHRVTLIEKRTELGGMVAALALEPLTSEFGNLIEYLRVQLEKLGVNVRLSTEAGATEIDELSPDVVIMATGSSMIIPEVAQGRPGVMDHIEALRSRKEIGHRVVVWGFTYGAELAISLAEEGREVVLIGEGAEKTLGGHASNFRRWWILRKLADVNTARGTPEAQRIANPRVLSNVKVEEVTAEGIALIVEGGDKQVLPYDALIISRGRERDNALSGQLEGTGPEVHEIGDCSSVGDIHKAIFSANEVARAI